jgi:shikimate kinase
MLGLQFFKRPKKPNIVLIGPPWAGKSTVGRRLAQLLGRKQVRMDDYKVNKMWAETGTDPAEHFRLYTKVGVMAAYEYGKPREALLTLDALAKTSGAVIDFGGGHSEYRQIDLFEQVRLALEDHITVLLLPSPDLELSRAILKKRGERYPQNWPLMEYLIESPCNHILADLIAYTHGKEIQHTAEEIIKRLPASPRGTSVSTGPDRG